MIIHEDDRRVLYDWANGEFKSAKAIVMKKKTEVGGHLHFNKDEEFLLLKGTFKVLELGNVILTDVQAPYHVIVPRGMYHRFVCEAGSILLGTATELFDKTDEIR